MGWIVSTLALIEELYIYVFNQLWRRIYSKLLMYYPPSVLSWSEISFTKSTVWKSALLVLRKKKGKQQNYELVSD
jgi:hypothetical protein